MPRLAGEQGEDEEVDPRVQAVAEGHQDAAEVEPAGLEVETPSPSSLPRQSW